VASEEEVAALKEQLGKAHKELDHLTTVGQDLRQKVRHLEEESKLISDRERKSLNLLKKREGELSLAQGEIDKLKYATKSGKRKTESEEAVCLKCKEHEQEIHLLKQMVKSTKGMVRVREIEVERYRMHNEEPSLKDNRSTGKINEKTPSLPPLKKKQLE
jgi:cell division protein ZapA (FtsZ GTPase activity inhibitor)